MFCLWMKAFYGLKTVSRTRYVEVRDKKSTSSYQKREKLLETRLHSIGVYLMSKTCIFTRSLRKKVSEIKVSELATSFSISSPGSLVFTIVLMTMRVFFAVNTIEKARDSRTSNYQLTGNS